MSTVVKTQRIMYVVIDGTGPVAVAETREAAEQATADTEWLCDDAKTSSATSGPDLDRQARGGITRWTTQQSIRGYTSNARTRPRPSRPPSSRPVTRM